VGKIRREKMNVTNLIAESTAAEYRVAKASYYPDDFRKVTLLLDHKEMSAVKANAICTKNEEDWIINMALDPIKSNYMVTVGATGILEAIAKKFIRKFLLNKEKKLED
jgi:hypothetical protein